jgi:hypothetical protein
VEHPEQAQLIRLRETLARSFNLSELQDLCFDLGIAYEGLAGSTIGDKARELLLLCVRQNRLADLVAHGRRIRPDIAWETALAGQPVPQRRNDDPEIIKARRHAYEELYRILKPFARYDLPEPVEAETLRRVTTAMRDWYFDAGGLYLTDQCREPYFALKEAIKTVLDHPRNQANQQIGHEDFDLLLGAASRLRAAMRDDLNLG